MEKSFAEKLIGDHRNAAQLHAEAKTFDCYKYMEATEKALLSALTIPSPREVDEDFPTVRDQFAMAALSSVIVLEQISTKSESKLVDAKMAYGYADAMIIARTQGGATK